MEIWLDTCDVQTVLNANELGLLYGVTTNPSILGKVDEDHDKLISHLLQIQEGPLAIQVVADESEEMIRQGLTLQSFSDKIIVKVPLTEKGLVAMKALVGEGVSIMATAIFHPRQALLAALVGADYVAPYIGRMFDQGTDAFSSLELMQSIFKAYDFKTKIMAAALRTTEQIMSCARLGVSAVTLKPSLFAEFVEEDASTLDSLKTFSQDWKNVKHKVFSPLS